MKMERLNQRKTRRMPVPKRMAANRRGDRQAFRQEASVTSSFMTCESCADLVVTGTHGEPELLHGTFRNANPENRASGGWTVRKRVGHRHCCGSTHSRRARTSLRRSGCVTFPFGEG